MLFLVESTFALVLPPPGQDVSSTGLAQILALVRHSDSVPVKSEGTRVLVNVIKSLWSNNVTSMPSSPTSPSLNDPNDVKHQEIQKKRAEAMQIVLTLEHALALASLISRSGRYPLLVNEGIVALSLLSTHKDGGKPLL